MREAFAVVRRGGLNDEMDAFALDREMRWVRERFVRGALDASDAATAARPPGLSAGLRAPADGEVARKLR